MTQMYAARDGHNFSAISDIHGVFQFSHIAIQHIKLVR